MGEQHGTRWLEVAASVSPPPQEQRCTRPSPVGQRWSLGLRRVDVRLRSQPRLPRGRWPQPTRRSGRSSQDRVPSPHADCTERRPQPLPARNGISPAPLDCPPAAELPPVLFLVRLRNSFTEYESSTGSVALARLRARKNLHPQPPGRPSPPTGSPHQPQSCHAPSATLHPSAGRSRVRLRGADRAARIMMVHTELPLAFRR